MSVGHPAGFGSSAGGGIDQDGFLDTGQGVAQAADRGVDASLVATSGLRQVRQWLAGHASRLRLVPPDGTPFGWLDLLTGEDGMSVSRQVLNRGGLIMPGETLDTAGGVRLTWAREGDLLAEGLRRIDGVLVDQAPPARE
jgi:hypothetical protein